MQTLKGEDGSRGSDLETLEPRTAKHDLETVILSHALPFISFVPLISPHNSHLEVSSSGLPPTSYNSLASESEI